MARKDGGWLFVFPDQGPDFGARYLIEQFRRLSFVLPHDMPLRARVLCLVGLEDEWMPGEEQEERRFLEFIAVANRGARVTSFERRVNLTNFVQFDRLSVGELLQLLPSRLHQNFGGQFIPLKTFAASLRALFQLRPEAREPVERLQQMLLPRPPQSSHSDEIVAHERDSVALALDLSGFDHRSVLPRGATDPGMAFLAGITRAAIREDQVIQHDASLFGDWSVLARYQVGASVFERRGERLTGINVNRNPIETSLGVDLIYYTHRFDAFALIQYKMLRQEGTEWVYRPDHQLEKELERMRRVPVGSWSGRPDDFRLTAEACFMKVCRPLLPDPLAEGLISGWYLPVSYWEALCASEEAKWARGGIAVKVDTIGRYLNNSQFVELVSRGWLGSRGHASGWIEDVIRLGLEEGRSIVLAAHVRT